jgi:hypothetical protein
MVQNGKLEPIFISILVNKNKHSMKIIKNNYIKVIFLLMLLGSVTSCDRELSENVEFTTFPTTGEVFEDAFSNGLQYFPFLGSQIDAFTVDTSEKYAGTASMRFDVPAFGINYAGANFPTTGPRDLRGYDALTFWAKGSQAATINELGFGLDGITNENKFRVVKSNTPITTKWEKYTIAIPDPSKLDAATGVFWYAEGAQDISDEGGYTFWIDDLKYEKLGTLGQPQPRIVNGEDRKQENFIGNSLNMSDYGLTQTFNLASGKNQTVTAAPMYFDFESSNIEVARVSETGIVRVVGIGTATITAMLAGVKAAGSLTIVSSGYFPISAAPSEDENNVISIFSDTYKNVPIDFHNGFWQPYQTTLGGETLIGGQNVLSYTDFNFVGTQLTNGIDITEMTHYSIDILMLKKPTDLDLLLTFKAVDGSLQQNRIGQSYQLDSTAPLVHSDTDFEAGVWETIKIPIRPTTETALDKTAINIIIIENIKSSNLKILYTDNMYFYKE